MTEPIAPHCSRPRDDASLARRVVSPAQIMKAFSDYQSTGFGGWPWETDALAFGRDRPRFAKYADGRLEERPVPK